MTQGTPNQIIVRGEYVQKTAEDDFNEAWATVTRACQKWLENQCKEWIDDHYQQWVDLGLWKGKENTKNRVLPWQKDWDNWTRYAWEFFHATGATITEARQNLNEQKRSRGWTGINWIGESSTLSGADGVAYPGMGLWTGKRQINLVDFKQWNESKKQEEIGNFYQLLSEKLSESIIDPTEQLNIPELIKRLILKHEIAGEIGIDIEDIPTSYQELNRFKTTDDKKAQMTGWFQGDGDKAGDFLKQIKNANDQDSEANELHQFSYAMRHWGEETFKNCIPKRLRACYLRGGRRLFRRFLSCPRT